MERGLTFCCHDGEDFSSPDFKGDSIEKSIVLPAFPNVEADVPKLQVGVLEAVVSVVVAWRSSIWNDGYGNAANQTRIMKTLKMSNSLWKIITISRITTSTVFTIRRPQLYIECSVLRCVSLKKFNFKKLTLKFTFSTDTIDDFRIDLL